METDKNKAQIVPLPSSVSVDAENSAPYKNCLNCGAELKGKFCHNCGQEATNTPTVKHFIFAYLDNAFMWDSQFLKTLWTMLRHPGRLTKNYNDGKYISQEHPLKLNMFLLFIFITLFLMFASTDKMNESVDKILNDERIFPHVQVELLMDDQEFVQRMQESPRDTIQICAPLDLTTEYPNVIRNIETYEDTQGESLDKWVAVVPHNFVEEEILVSDESGYYYFNTEVGEGAEMLAMIYAIWVGLNDIISQYFPMLLLLTVPFLTFALSVVMYRRRLPRLHHFIFSLHYTAFLEFLIICVYLLYLTIAPPMEVLEYIILIGSCLYLTIAYRTAYTSTWVKAIVKSLLTSLIYFIILLLIFIVIFFIVCFTVVLEMV